VGPGSPARVYSKRFAIPADAIDRQGHVNNLACISWMQDVAIEHSAAAGWPMERYLALGAGWVVRSHFVEYLRPRWVFIELTTGRRRALPEALISAFEVVRDEAEARRAAGLDPSTGTSGR
jgi:acyl-CoA thioesterase FadM